MATPGEEQERNQSAPLLGLNKDPAQGISASQTSRAASHVQKDFYSNKKTPRFELRSHKVGTWIFRYDAFRLA